MTPSTQTYTPTLMQKLLGRNYKWLYFINFHFTRVAKFRLTMYSIAFSELITISVVLLIWQNKSEGISKEITTYLVIGYLFNLLTRNYVFNWLPDLIYSGKLSNWLMYPVAMFKQIFGRATGQLLIANLIASATFPFIFLYTFQSLLLPQSVFSSIIFISLMGVSYVIGIFYNIIASTCAFYTPEYAGIIVASNTILKVLSSYFFPFSLITGLGWLSYNPLAFTFYHPMQIYLGKYSTLETLYVFGGGIAWCVVLYFLARWVFKMGLKRNEAVGL